jgi:hypothetical protein
MALIFDTGSDTIGVESSDLIQCQTQPGDPCRYGTYSNLSSSIAELVETGGYYDGTGNMRFGNFVSDVVAFGGRSFDNITFGQVVYEDFGDFSFPTYQGLVGKFTIFLSLILVHVANTHYCVFIGFNGRCNATEHYCELVLLQQLYDRRLISSRAFSFNLGPLDGSSNGSFVIGGVDRAKSSRDVVVLNMADPFSSTSNDAYLYHINYTSMVSTLLLRMCFHISQDSRADCLNSL